MEHKHPFKDLAPGKYLYRAATVKHGQAKAGIACEVLASGTVRFKGEKHNTLAVAALPKTGVLIAA